MKNIEIIFRNLLCFAFGMIILIAGISWNSSMNEALKQNCKICFVFDKDCPYTMQELDEQEYGTGDCRDMGTYEMQWKLSAGVVAVGVFTVVMAFYNPKEKKDEN